VACPALQEFNSCNPQACPVDCVVSGWGSWTLCTKSCNGGSQSSTRTVTQTVQNGGKACPELVQEQTCNTQCCPINGALSGWSAWSTCSRTCGGGRHSRSRTVTTEAACGGYPTSSVLREEDDCNALACPVDCKLTDWGAWGSCTVTCGGGTVTRTRTITRDVADGGKACGDLEDVESCSPLACPVHCEVSRWNDWSECTVSCEGGTQTRSRKITTASAHGGSDCPTLQETTACNTEVCPDPTDCEVSGWKIWTPCTKSCGGGSKSRSRTVTVKSKDGGAACPDLRETLACSTWDCAVDCVAGKWNKWSLCSQTCGRAGSQNRRRVIITPASLARTYGKVTIPAGKACGDTSETRPCNRFACPVDCQVGEWTDYSACSLTCGPVSGTQTRTRELLVDFENGGKVCPTLLESRSCNSGPCPVHCEVSEWDAFSTCTKTCGSGTHHRSRRIIKHAAFGGYVCPRLYENVPCNEHCCPVSCVVGSWSTFGTYSGGGMNLKRTRPVSVAPSCGGVACPAMEELKIFHHPDCNSEKVGESSDCSKTCGTDGYKKTNHEFIRCGGAAVRLHVKYTKIESCNIKQCATEEEKSQPHKDVTAPEVNSNIAADEMQLVESIGNWVPVTQDDLSEYDLQAEVGMQKFQRSL